MVWYSELYLFEKRWQNDFKEETFISYLVCHMDKYKRDDIVGIERENERDENCKSTRNPQIDSQKTNGNYHIVEHQCSYLTYINQRIKELAPKRKIKDDAVLINSFILGSDKEFFDGLTQEEQYSFFFDCARFFAERYGLKNIISAVVHVDETTPHMHLNLMPVLDGRLCSKQLFDKVALRELQTDFHEAVGKRWGLQRGKIGSTAKHWETAEFKAKKIIEGAEKQAEDFLTKVHGAVDEAKNKPVPKKKEEAAEEITYLRTENAALKKHIEIKNRDTADLFSQMQTAQKRNETAERALGMILDMEAAYPEELSALLHKSRQKKSPPVNSNKKYSGRQYEVKEGK